MALPILEDALAALDTIKEADITYIRKLGNPPGAIKLVMEVCHLYIARHLPWWCLLALPDIVTPSCPGVPLCRGVVSA